MNAEAEREFARRVEMAARPEVVDACRRLREAREEVAQMVAEGMTVRELGLVAEALGI